MKCRECDCCKKGWFKSKPNDYVCTGVKEPFVIENIDVECPEYPEKRIYSKKRRKYKNIEDALYIGVDFNSNSNFGCLAVTRQKGDKIYVINLLHNDEALDLYNKLIGEQL